eukprot:TRINITY_DN2134_c0_g1_i2.p1 TRINITY_DN2134_c0_g1~~TRINITY_DN2134_c0_g1_i2.p1  ORF type:complete len:376 (+),score=87.82 TRINITY_DN2134_c0_g1_i2:242-1369(+)
MLDSGTKSSSQENTGAYVSFAMVNKNNSDAPSAFNRVDKWDLSSFSVSDYFSVQITNGSQTQFSLLVEGDNNFAVYGNMNVPSHAWHLNGIDANTVIEWDLKIERIYGWYGPSGLWEDIDDTLGRGEILWNTYSHDARVSGTINVGGVTYTIEDSPSFRAYCDMNWGEKFPESGSYPPIEYPWSWFKIGIVLESSSSAPQEISIIAGTGLTYTGFPAYNVYGAFADIRLGTGETSPRIEARQVQVLVGTPLQRVGLSDTNDGSIYNFSVTRTAWSNFTDDLGTDPLPLQQTLVIETEHYSITLRFNSTLADYNRLVFPYSEYLYSDFEALGVSCDVAIQSRSSADAPWQNYLIFSVEDAGLEYGYHAPVSSQPLL